MKSWKNGPQKLLIIGAKLFFHKYDPVAQASPELIFHIINMSQDSSASLSVGRPQDSKVRSKCIKTALFHFFVYYAMKLFDLFLLWQRI